MTREKARELPAVQAQTGGGYNRNAARLILAGVLREHGQPAAEKDQTEGLNQCGLTGLNSPRQKGPQVFQDLKAGQQVEVVNAAGQTFTYKVSEVMQIPWTTKEGRERSLEERAGFMRVGYEKVELSDYF